MSATKKWALGGMICALIALIVFSTVFITGEMPGEKIMAVVGYVLVILDALEIGRAHV